MTPHVGVMSCPSQQHWITRQRANRHRMMKTIYMSPDRLDFNTPQQKELGGVDQPDLQSTRPPF